MSDTYTDGPLPDYINHPEIYKDVAMSHRTDKGEHGYLSAYARLAAELGTAAHVCELGVLGGASLMMWKETFSQGLVVGVDNNNDAFWPEGAYKVISDQDDPYLPDYLAAISPQYDLIIDDCSHVGRLTAESFRLLWPLVRSGGYYVIEDWKCGDDREMATVAESFFHILSNEPYPFTFDSVEYVRGRNDNSALVIVRKR